MVDVQNFFIEYNSKLCKVNSATDQISLLKKLREFFPQTALFSDDTFYFEVKDPNYAITHRVDCPEDVYANAVVMAKTHKGRIPLRLLVGSRPVMEDLGPTDAAKTVRLRGLPWQCTPDEIRVFLEEPSLPDQNIFIQYTDYCGKKHNGDALIQSMSDEQLERIMSKNKGEMLGRFVEVKQVSQEDLLIARKKEYERSKNVVLSIPVDRNSFVVSLIGLPWETLPSEVRNFLYDVPITAMHFPKDKMGRSTGMALIELANEEFLMRALGHDKEYIGHRFIEIRKSSINELVKKMSHFGSSTGNMAGSSKNMRKAKIYCAFIENIPSSSTNYAIDNFFNEHMIPPIRIHKKIQGCYAYCEFASKSEIEKAVSLNGQILDGNSLKIMEVSFDEVARNVGIDLD